MSPPEPAPPSVSLPEPPPPRARLAVMLLDGVGLREMAWGAEDEGTSGESGREGGWRLLLACAWGWDEEVRGCFFLCFLRVDSLPLASELRGEPGRLRLLEEVECLRGSACLEGRLEGVLVPEESFGLCFSCLSGVVLVSSAFLRSSSFRRSVSVESDSLLGSVSMFVRMYLGFWLLPPLSTDYLLSQNHRCSSSRASSEPF